jgi:hypothetical protein
MAAASGSQLVKVFEFRVSRVELVELDFNQGFCEVGEAYSCPIVKSMVVFRLQLDEEPNCQ